MVMSYIVEENTERSVCCRAVAVQSTVGSELGGVEGKSCCSAAESWLALEERAGGRAWRIYHPQSHQILLLS